jgi:hypothetical protein
MWWMVSEMKYADRRTDKISPLCVYFMHFTQSSNQTIWAQLINYLMSCDISQLSVVYSWALIEQVSQKLLIVRMKHFPSWQKQEVRSACPLLFACCFHGLLFDPEDGGSKFFRNGGKLLPHYVGFHMWQLWLWRFLSYGIQRHVVCWKSTDVSEEHVASIFRVEE